MSATDTAALVRQMREALDDARDDVLDVLSRAKQMSGPPRLDVRIKAQHEQLARHDAAIAAADQWLAQQRGPMTDAEINKGRQTELPTLDHYWSVFDIGVRWAERAHGILKPAGDDAK